jgi:ABC-type dipeptide/oligopeptide/nickel transport system ATPase subunit
MNAPAPRVFEAKSAVRESVPLLVGLMGPSGGGKTFSALRLATGIQKVTGGDIYAIDTEARRMLHYADRFKFKHVQFDAPFGSLDYLAAIQQCVKAGAGVVIIDSHVARARGRGRHARLPRSGARPPGRRRLRQARARQDAGLAEAEGGALGDDQRDPAVAGQLHFLLPRQGEDEARRQGKVVPQGFMPIAGEELVFEMTVNCLLLPHADGVPTWQSEQVGER